MTQRIVGTIGTIESIASERRGVQDVVVRVASLPSAKDYIVPSDSLLEKTLLETSEGTNSASARQAINLIALTGSVKPGDQVILNTVAVELRLGNDTRNIVAAILPSDKSEESERSVSENRDSQKAAPLAPSPSTVGQICKLRGTPLQTSVTVVESSKSPYYETLCQFESLQEMPVVCAQLHSQLPAIVAGARWALQQGNRANPRIAFIMTEGGALPLAQSQLVEPLKERDWICATITSGQAFGGDYECINLYSALATACAVIKADMVVICQGPGEVETGTPLGFSGIEQGQAINAVASLGGTAIAAVQVCFDDRQTEPRGLSRHSITVLGQITHASALVALPQLPEEEMQFLLGMINASNLAELHQPVIVMANRAFDKLQASNLMKSIQEEQRKAEPAESVSLESGRTASRRNGSSRIEDDRAFLLASCAAGVLAGQLLESGIEE